MLGTPFCRARRAGAPGRGRRGWPLRRWLQPGSLKAGWWRRLARLDAHFHAGKRHRARRHRPRPPVRAAARQRQLPHHAKWASGSPASTRQSSARLAFALRRRRPGADRRGCRCSRPGFEAPAAACLRWPSLGHLLGTSIERWLFFAEARHAMMNYLRRLVRCGHRLAVRPSGRGGPVIFQRLWNHIHWPGSSRTQRSTTSLSNCAVAATSTLPSAVARQRSFSSSPSRKRLPGRRIAAQDRRRIHIDAPAWVRAGWSRTAGRRSWWECRSRTSGRPARRHCRPEAGKRSAAPARDGKSAIGEPFELVLARIDRIEPEELAATGEVVDRLVVDGVEDLHLEQLTPPAGCIVAAGEGVGERPRTQPGATRRRQGQGCSRSACALSGARGRPSAARTRGRRRARPPRTRPAPARRAVAPSPAG